MLTAINPDGEMFRWPDSQLPTLNPMVLAHMGDMFGGNSWHSGPTPHSWLKVEEVTSAGLLVTGKGRREGLGERGERREVKGGREMEKDREGGGGEWESEEGEERAQTKRERVSLLETRTACPRQSPFLKKKEIGHRIWVLSQAPTDSSAGHILFY